MLDDYKDKQHNVYNILINEIKNKQISHAYLFDENNNSESFNIVMAFVKEILCMNISSSVDREKICRRVDDGNYPEIKIIKPDGMLIKKQQIIDLQKEFALSAVEGNRRLYIIRDCEKMRPETANSMLKFLEEPDNNLIAILMTNNYNNLLSTIISRCQIIRLSNNQLDDYNNTLNDVVLNFIKSIEKDGIKTIIKTNDLLFNYVSLKDRDGLISFFDKILDMYYDILKINISCKEIKNVNYYDELEKISKINDYNVLLNKINFLIQTKDSIKYNVNCNLLVDSLIVNIGG